MRHLWWLLGAIAGVWVIINVASAIVTILAINVVCKEAETEDE